jgi:hypothetical protein
MERSGASLRVKLLPEHGLRSLIDSSGAWKATSNHAHGMHNKNSGLPLIIIKNCSYLTVVVSNH